MINKIVRFIIFVLAVGAVFWFLRRPETKVLAIPFTTQAPTGLWENNLNCEEASVAMVQAYFQGMKSSQIPTNEAFETIKKLNDWERENFGYNQDTGVADTGKMATLVFKLRNSVLPDFTEDDLKNEIANGHPILLPINAGLLNNPKYISKGSFYHMIVIKGYRGDKFIVNDPGTESGKDNEYTFETLKNATADWNQRTHSMNPSSKPALVLSK